MGQSKLAMRALALFVALFWAGLAQAAERAELRAFLEITGFDVAIASMQQNALAGPALAGEAPSAFGSEWTRLAGQIFDPDDMVERAMDMMEAIMPDALVEHGAAFYASDLGQRIVQVENKSHMVPDERKYAEAEQIVAGLMATESSRIQSYRAMSTAIGGVDNAVRTAIEIQVRYLMAAMNAGTTDIEMDEEDLRGLLQQQSDEIRQSVEVHSVMSAAFAYRDVSDEDLQAYVDALEDPEMRQVYEILNAIQFEVMAERYERLAAALAGVSPQTDI